MMGCKGAVCQTAASGCTKIKQQVWSTAVYQCQGQNVHQTHLSLVPRLTPPIYMYIYCFNYFMLKCVGVCKPNCQLHCFSDKQLIIQTNVSRGFSFFFLFSSLSTTLSSLSPSIMVFTIVSRLLSHRQSASSQKTEELESLFTLATVIPLSTSKLMCFEWSL